MNQWRHAETFPKKSIIAGLKFILLCLLSRRKGGAWVTDTSKRIQVNKSDEWLENCKIWHDCK